VVRASGYAYAENGFYQEPAWLVDSLLNAEPVTGRVYDPFCGEGTIPKACIARGIEAIGSDICDRGYGAAGVDFFQVTGPLHCDILTNPDYSKLRPAVDHALAVATGKVIVLARLAFLESQRRREWFLATRLARVWVSSRRPSMPPGGQGIVAKGGSIPFAFFVWDRSHIGAPELGWLS
jgi:hypothetical protein